MFSLFIHTKRIETLRTCVTNKQKLCTNTCLKFYRYHSGIYVENKNITTFFHHKLYIIFCIVIHYFFVTRKRKISYLMNIGEGDSHYLC